jgi:hypothetical protein
LNAETEQDNGFIYFWYTSFPRLVWPVLGALKLLNGPRAAPLNAKLCLHSVILRLPRRHRRMGKMQGDTVQREALTAHRPCPLQPSLFLERQSSREDGRDWTSRDKPTSSENLHLPSESEPGHVHSSFVVLYVAHFDRRNGETTPPLLNVAG